jgi:hypothetical protein
MLGRNYFFESCVGPANQALEFFEFQSVSYCRAVEAWTFVGIRKNVVKDIRRLIAELIWEARDDAVYILDKKAKGSNSGKVIRSTK